ncbi:MAG: sensor histidine kinase [Novosphingobium sp.]
MIRRLWPRSLQGQVLLTIALALLLAQAIGAALLYRAQAERRDALLTHTAALRMFAAVREEAGLPPPFDISGPRRGRGPRHQVTAESPLRAGEKRLTHAEAELSEMLAGQGMPLAQVVVFQRAVSTDPVMAERIARRRELLGRTRIETGRRLVIAAAQPKAGSRWLVVRIAMPRTDARPLAGVIAQTLLIYAVLVGAVALILRRITGPLAALTRRVERFGETRDRAGQLAPEGPDDLRRLIEAHNAMENRVAALLDEKDVMLGAIGHDLKTPLTALRVRIESVEDEAERAKMAATIEDITRSLDDILSLARVGRPSDPREPTELAALVAAVAEEYEDMGEPVTLGETARAVLSLRATWLRRAVRNLISNALRYGAVARVGVVREESAAVILVEDEGPGIPDDRIAAMMEPFTRGEPSRSSETGGAGLGLTLARAIAEQHGGTLTLANRREEGGEVLGLTATLRLPL